MNDRMKQVKKISNLIWAFMPTLIYNTQVCAFVIVCPVFSNCFFFFFFLIRANFVILWECVCVCVLDNCYFGLSIISFFFFCSLKTHLIPIYVYKWALFSFILSSFQNVSTFVIWFFFGGNDDGNGNGHNRTYFYILLFINKTFQVYTL